MDDEIYRKLEKFQIFQMEVYGKTELSLNDSDQLSDWTYLGEVDARCQKPRATKFGEDCSIIVAADFENKLFSSIHHRFGNKKLNISTTRHFETKV